MAASLVLLQVRERQAERLSSPGTRVESEILPVSLHVERGPLLLERTFRQVLQNPQRDERTLAMSFDVLHSPVQFLQQVGISADQDWLREYEAWFEREGQGISDAVDRAGTPWLRMFDRLARGWMKSFIHLNTGAW